MFASNLIRSIVHRPIVLHHAPRFTTQNTKTRYTERTTVVDQTSIPHLYILPTQSLPQHAMLRLFTSATRHLPSKVKHSSALSRHLSTPAQATIKHPFSLTKEIAVGIQDSTALFIKHGVGMQKLQMIAKEAGNTETLVNRWQRMMEAYLGTQVHVLAGLGYQPNENGLREYT